MCEDIDGPGVPDSASDLPVGTPVVVRNKNSSLGARRERSPRSLRPLIDRGSHLMKVKVPFECPGCHHQGRSPGQIPGRDRDLSTL